MTFCISPTTGLLKSVALKFSTYTSFKCLPFIRQSNRTIYTTQDNTNYTMNNVY